MVHVIACHISTKDGKKPDWALATFGEGKAPKKTYITDRSSREIQQRIQIVSKKDAECEMINVDDSRWKNGLTIPGNRVLSIKSWDIESMDFIYVSTKNLNPYMVAGSRNSNFMDISEGYCMILTMDSDAGTYARSSCSEGSDYTTTDPEVISTFCYKGGIGCVIAWRAGYIKEEDCVKGALAPIFMLDIQAGKVPAHIDFTYDVGAHRMYLKSWTITNPKTLELVKHNLAKKSRISKRFVRNSPSCITPVIIIPQNRDINVEIEQSEFMYKSPDIVRMIVDDNDNIDINNEFNQEIIDNLVANRIKAATFLHCKAPNNELWKKLRLIYIFIVTETDGVTGMKAIATN